MTANNTRREFLRASAAGLVLPATVTAADPKAKSISVVVWDERQPEQKQAYDNFLGNQIADHLKDKPGLAVKSVSIEDDEKGLSPAHMRGCDVLVWWGHKCQAEITPKMAQPLIQRIKEGTLSLIALHSAHWSTPFVEAMYERTRLDAEKALKRDGAKVEITYADPPKRYTLPKAGDRLTPYTELKKFPDGTEKATVFLPYCCFPAYRADGKPSQARVTVPHPDPPHASSTNTSANRRGPIIPQPLPPRAGHSELLFGPAERASQENRHGPPDRNAVRREPAGTTHFPHLCG